MEKSGQTFPSSITRGPPVIGPKEDPCLPKRQSRQALYAHITSDQGHYSVLIYWAVKAAPLWKGTGGFSGLPLIFKMCRYPTCGTHQKSEQVNVGF